LLTPDLHKKGGKQMVKLFNQISLSDTFEECKDAFQNDKPKFLELLTKHLDLSSLVPMSFYWAYNKTLGRNRSYSLLSMLAAIVLQKILGIPTVSLLIIFLTLSSEAREFCGLASVPDDSQFTRFKQDFVTEIENMFNLMVDVTEPICRAIDPKLASTIAFDTSGIEAYVTENNPKFINSIIRKLKHYYKNKPDVDVYKMAYGLMPSSASANHEIQQLYINGYFCYVYKFAIITNGLGIVRNITFLDNDFKLKHPELPIDKKSDSPDEDKSISDSKSLKPVLADFFNLHPHIHYDTFLGDSIFDTYATYPMLLDDFKFSRVLIPLNSRNSNPDLPPISYNDNGWPLCSKDPSKTMKPGGWCYEQGRPDRFKWRCPKVKLIKGKWITSCQNPCNGKPCGRVTYTQASQDQRMYPGVIRESEEWISNYKIRGVVEQNIQYFKEPMACGNLKTRDRLTIKADLLLAGITQLITVVVADKLTRPKLCRSLKPLIA
jgi:hypothetical protein